MAEPSKRQSGNSMVELVMVMTLLILFGVTIFTLISAGSSAQKKVIDGKNSQTDARTAISYLNVKLRQSCESGKITVAPNPIGDGNAILIENKTDSYDTWVFFSDGKIYEFLGNPGEEPSVALSSEIIGVADFSVSYDADTNCVKTDIAYDYLGRRKSLASTVFLRVAGEDGVN